MDADPLRQDSPSFFREMILNPAKLVVQRKLSPKLARIIMGF